MVKRRIAFEIAYVISGILSTKINLNISKKNVIFFLNDMLWFLLQNLDSNKSMIFKRVEIKSSLG